MTSAFVGPGGDEEASLLADLAQLTPRPSTLPTILESLGYAVASCGDGYYAAGLKSAPALLVPLYRQAGLTVRRRDLIGRHVARSTVIASVIAVLRHSGSRPTLLFLHAGDPLPAGIASSDIVSLEGGLSPRIWPDCFGSFDVTIRVIGRPHDPAYPNVAVNAVEDAVPILQALHRLKTDLRERSLRPRQSADAPLSPRLSINAVHGGWSGSTIPTLCDIVVNRRYDPAERLEEAFDEIAATAAGSARHPEFVTAAIGNQRDAKPDPTPANRSPEDAALAEGWNWPQTPFRADAPIVLGSRLLGGLERPGEDPAADSASTTLDEAGALMRTLKRLMASW